MAKLTPIKAIRAKCLDCSCGSFTEIKNCTVTNCALYEYRMGHRPKPEESKMSLCSTCLNIMNYPECRSSAITCVGLVEKCHNYIPHIMEGKAMNYRFINASNEEVPFVVVGFMMDDDIREDLHLEMGGHCSEAEFFEEYCRRHLVKYGEEFWIRMDEYND